MTTADKEPTEEDGLRSRTASPSSACGRSTPWCFDKTGTLTKGQPAVIDIAAADDKSAVAPPARPGRAVESDSEHPLARVIVGAAQASGATAVASGFRSLTVVTFRPRLTARRSPSVAGPCFAERARTY
jgi:P-type Cu2+ transporter